MSDENKKWILAAKNQERKHYGMQYNNESSNSGNKRVTFSNNVNTHEISSDNTPNSSPGNNTTSTTTNQGSGNNNKPPQSIFRRQSMVKTNTNSPEDKGGFQTLPKAAYDESKPMDPVEYLTDQSQWKNSFAIDTITVITSNPPSFEVTFC
jgi:hypothetical protein